jgi:hypothetical protein
MLAMDEIAVVLQLALVLGIAGLAWLVRGLETKVMKKDMELRNIQQIVERKKDMELCNIQQIEERKYQVEIMRLKAEVEKLKRESKTKQQIDFKGDRTEAVPALTSALARVRARRGTAESSLRGRGV